MKLHCIILQMVCPQHLQIIEFSEATNFGLQKTIYTGIAHCNKMIERFCYYSQSLCTILCRVRNRLSDPLKLIQDGSKNGS